MMPFSTILMLRIPKKHGRGYTLVELATVMTIITLIALTLVPRLSVQVDQQHLKEDRILMSDAGKALRQFITVNGRLPCPAIIGSNGFESFSVDPGPTYQITCSANFGFLPARSLGLSNLDANGLLPNMWGRAINNPNNSFSLLYAVTDLSGAGVPASLNKALMNIGATTNWALNGNRRSDIQTALNVTNPVNGTGISLCTAAVALAPSSLNCGAPGAVYLTDLVAVIISPGANGVGSPPPSIYETQNALIAGHLGRTFYQLPYTGSPSGTGSSLNFDDTFEVVSFGDMLSQLSAGGWTFAP